MHLRLLSMSALLIFPGLFNTARAEDAVSRRAILIGVTAYPNVGKEFQLQGGTNDVTVVARVLRDKFGFQDEDISILSEEHGRNDETKLPNRKNIERALVRLGKGVRQGDQVVVFLAGHGTELPTPSGPAGHFLPRDVAPWKGEGQTGSVPNAIAGTEIGTWLRPIAEARANLWVIVDACFTGRMVRGGAGKVRQLPTDPAIKGGLQVPQISIKKHSKQDAMASNVPIPLPNYEGVACLYACSPDEVTLEERTADGDAHAPVLGLFTRALGDVLLNASSEISYRELHGRIRKFYAATGRHTSPNPIVEGAAINRSVLQSKLLQRKAFLVRESDEGDLTVDAGLLHGLTVDSIMAVYPPPGQGDKLRGYVKLIRVGSTTSECEPHAEVMGQLPKKATLIDGRAELHRIEYGENRLPVALDPVDTEGRNVPDDIIAPLRELLKEMSAEKAASFRLTDSLTEGRLLLRCKGTQICLIPSLLQFPSREASSRVLSCLAQDGELRPQLQQNLERVARAHALLRCYADASRDPAVKISTDLLRIESAASTTGTPLLGAVKQVRPGDYVAYEVKNQSGVSVDVTILYIDANFEIDAFFPSKNELNRIPPGRSLPLEVFRVNDKTTGMEYAVIIAVENRDKEIVELTALAPSRRSIAGSVKQLDTPLGLLLDQSLGARDKKRSATRSLSQSYAIDLLAVEVISSE